MHRLVVDRREDGLVVVLLEDGTVLELPEWLLPPAAREGDVVRVRSAVDGTGARQIRLTLDADATRAARGAAGAMLARLRAGDPGGDIAL